MGKLRKMTESIVKHHISHKPPIVQFIPLKKHQKIHDNIPIISDLSLKMRQYDWLVKVSVMLKNWSTAYKRQFGENPIDIGLAEIEMKKKEILKDAKVIIREDLKKVTHIKGLGVRFLAGLLAYAHPSRFSNLHKFLHYCGYKGSAKISKKYSRKVCSLVHQIAKSLLMHKDPEYYSLYQKLRNDLRSKYPNARKIKTYNIAINRVGTFFLKEIYYIFRGNSLGLLSLFTTHREVLGKFSPRATKLGKVGEGGIDAGALAKSVCSSETPNGEWVATLLYPKK